MKEDNKKKTVIFAFKPGALEIYVELCQKLNLDTEEKRITALTVMAEMGYMQSIQTTNRSRDQVVKDWSNHFNILDLRRKEDDSGESETSS